MLRSDDCAGTPLSLQKRIDAPRRRHLVFTSAGDNSNVRCWLDAARQFDLWVSYYGGASGTHQDEADYYNVLKAGKFQALHAAMRQFPEIFQSYDAIFVVDDDLVFSARDIDTLFQIRQRMDLLLVQPAFDPRGKISHRITEYQPFSALRYTNFVEVTCPLFRGDVLRSFMEIYDPRLVGWGVDWWFSHLVDSMRDNGIAVVDAVTCVNPEDDAKANGREIDRLQSIEERQNVWARVKKERQLEHLREETVQRGPPVKSRSLRTLRTSILYIARKSYWSLLNRLR